TRPLLHSFPTRRSSDLTLAKARMAMSRPWCHCRPPGNSTVIFPLRGARARGEKMRASTLLMNTEHFFDGAERSTYVCSQRWLPRSEEHTSELQSPDHLV